MEYFKDRLVYITGGSSGIGLETARQIAAKGAHITLFARNEAGLEAARMDIERCRRFPEQRVYTLKTDVADNGSCRDKMLEAVRTFGTPDIVITSAGVGSADLFENISFEAFEALMKINVYGTRSVIAALLPFMKEKGGHFVIISSAAGLMGMYGYTSYSTTKYALVGLAECLRSEFKPHGIAVTLVCPPEVDTPFLAHESSIPAEARAMKNFAGTLKSEEVARTIVKGIEKRKFLVVPGMLARLVYLNHRLTNGNATRFTSDLIVKWVRFRKGLPVKG